MTGCPWETTLGALCGVSAILAAAAGVSTGFAADARDPLGAALAKYRQADYPAAVRLASEAVEQEAHPVEALRLRAAAYEELGEYRKAIADWDRLLELRPDDPGGYQARGELHFKAGQIRASIADFDAFLARRPEQDPHHWQRGISYYYAGEFERGMRQFERHQAVNSQDVENAVWHYLCKARVDGVDRARQALIDISRDRRPWAMDVYRMFQGQATPQEVIVHAERASGSEAARKDNLFYAHLYVGLLHESEGRPAESRKHIETAVREYLSPHYMGDVARVHLQLRKEADKTLDEKAEEGAK